MQILNFLSNSGASENDVLNLASKVELSKATDSKVSLLVPVDTVRKCVRDISVSDCVRLNESISGDHIIKSSAYVEQQRKQFLLFHLDQQNFIKHILDAGTTEACSPSCGKRVIVEFR